MSQTITPQEFHLLNDNPTIRTKCPRAFVTDEQVSRQVRRGNLVAGDTVLVQCFDNDYSTLLAECEYRVTRRNSNLRMVERPDFSMHQFDDVTFEIAKVSDWRIFHEEVAEGVETPAAEPEKTVRWNLGKKRFDVLCGEAVVGSHVDKDMALKMASGEIELSDAE